MNISKLREKFRQCINEARYINSLIDHNSPDFSLIDIGCGKNSPVQNLENQVYKIGVDGFNPDLELSKSLGIHDEYIQAEILDFVEKEQDNSYDYVVSLDVIEHFDKPIALQLIAHFERIARYKVIISTPNGYVPQEPSEAQDGNEYQRHLCGFSYNELNELGYSVRGFYGFYALRGAYCKIKYSPKALFNKIAKITQLLNCITPKYSYHLVASKLVETKTLEGN